jgi:hypothetical protein
MMRKSTFPLVALGLTLAIADLPQGGISGGASLIKEAHAVVGRPMTPVSAAGVARRTTRRAVVATSVYVATLPPSCTVVVIEGATLYLCGTTYYQASGTQYVVVNVQ